MTSETEGSENSTSPLFATHDHTPINDWLSKTEEQSVAALIVILSQSVTIIPCGAIMCLRHQADRQAGKSLIAWEKKRKENFLDFFLWTFC
jgi:hypothetical protein